MNTFEAFPVFSLYLHPDMVIFELVPPLTNAIPASMLAMKEHASKTVAHVE